jgi:5-hydroxyisourate hydrolase
VAAVSGRSRVTTHVLDAVSGHPGTYRVRFDTAAYFAASGTAAFFPEVVIAFTLENPDAHYHVPLLLSPYAYSTYRGS